MPYIKSHSNYVLKKRHQSVDDGTIYERDITTIGGRNSFSPNQVPLYQSGNFVITVNNDDNVSRNHGSAEWQKNSDGEVWTLKNLSALKTEDKSDDRIRIKRDYYDLRDFAYFGSCSELIRASINDIISKFPGELYVPYGKSEEYLSLSGGVAIFYTDDNAFHGGDIAAINDKFNNSVDTALSGVSDSMTEFKRLGDVGSAQTHILVDNPFNIDIYTNNISTYDVNDPLKYFANNGYKEYEAIDDSGNKYPFTWSASTVHKLDESGKSDESKPFCKGEKIADIIITITTSVDSYDRFTIEAWIGNDNEVIYLIDTAKNEKLFKDNGFKYKIRPKQSHIDAFFKSLDDFENILINPLSSPKYTATFNLLAENEYGYYTYLDSFTFPTTYGGYNLGSHGPAFDSYVESLASIGEFYDERFSDNVYRSLTHEAIKNFDWTKQYKNDEEESDEDGNRVGKMLRIFGRQADDILAYVNNIAYYKTVTYDNINNLPDYFLSDELSIHGWDVKQVIPYSLNERTESGRTVENNTADDEFNNLYQAEHVNRIFTQSSISVKPYSKISDGQFYGCFSGITNTITDTLFINGDSGCSSSNTLTIDAKNESYKDITVKSYQTYLYKDSSSGTSSDSADIKMDSSGQSDIIRLRVRDYSSENEWPMTKVNNEFIKRLLINSRSIWQHKGSQESIEMVLGMFGMKSKRWYDALPDTKKDKYSQQFSDTDNFKAYRRYDYEIKEYTSFARRIEDRYDAALGDYRIDWFNKAKTIPYQDTEYVSYRGLPVVYRNAHDKNEDIRYLYPDFQKNKKYDGNIYYQMKGGWLAMKPYMFDKDNNIVAEQNNQKVYKESVKSVRSVSKLRDLFLQPTQTLQNGDIFYVDDLSGRYAIVDGVAYNIEQETDDNITNEYFTVQVENGNVTIGNAYFDNYVVVSDIYGTNKKYRYSLANGDSNGMSIKVYILTNEDGRKTIEAYSDEASVSTFSIFENGQYEDGTGYTHYFRINDISGVEELGIFGWQQLKSDDEDYYKVNGIEDDYSGNNPHTGHLHYDNGHEYFTYFRHLFRYAVDNEMLNYGYLNDYSDIIGFDPATTMYDIGFKGLINDDVCQLDYDDFLTDDCKIHYFGNYYKNIYDEKKVANYYYDEFNEYSGKTGENRYYSLGDINARKTQLGAYGPSSSFYGWINQPCKKTGSYSNEPLDGVTNQIMNTKIVKIIFYLRSKDFHNKSAQEEIKYLQDVVIPYMSQVIPSSIILDIECNYMGQNIHSYTVKTNVNGEPVDGIDVSIVPDEHVGTTEQGMVTFEKDDQDNG